MSWNYRIVREQHRIVDKISVHYGIREAYYDIGQTGDASPDDAKLGYTVSDMEVSIDLDLDQDDPAQARTDLAWMIDQMQKALTRPIIDDASHQPMSDDNIRAMKGKLP